MRLRLKALLIVLVTSAALLVVGQASPAHAAYCGESIRGNVYFHNPYANTGYGPTGPRTASTP